MTRWKSQIKRVRTKGGPNYVRIAYQSLQILVRSHVHMMKLAPLLFDHLAIEREVAKRFLAIKRHVLSQPQETDLAHGLRESDLKGETAELLAGAWKKLRSKVMEEAWEDLSPEMMEALKLEWRVLNLASHVTEKAATNLTSYLRSADLSISEFLTLTLSMCEIAKAHRWNVPPHVSRLDVGLEEWFMEEMAESDTTPPQADPLPACASLQTPAPSLKVDQNRTRHSNNIIRLTTFLSAMHEEEEKFNGSATPSQRAAVG